MLISKTWPRLIRSKIGCFKSVPFRLQDRMLSVCVATSIKSYGHGSGFWVKIAVSDRNAEKRSFFRVKQIQESSARARLGRGWPRELGDPGNLDQKNNFSRRCSRPPDRKKKTFNKTPEQYSIQAYFLLLVLLLSIFNANFAHSIVGT